MAATQNGPVFTPIPGDGLKVNFTATPDVILSSSTLRFEVTPTRAFGPVGQFVL